MGGYSQQCPCCPKWFLSYGSLKDHMKGKHPGAPYGRHPGGNKMPCDKEGRTIWPM